VSQEDDKRDRDSVSSDRLWLVPGDYSLILTPMAESTGATSHLPSTAYRAGEQQILKEKQALER
jgi:hypothetical protein